ncbi:MAG: EcsC family protein [Eubacteriales bacterium]|nr:EcsC family protein [Eubacteriales bacterium]
MYKPEIAQDQIMSILDTCYNAAINGIPGSENCNVLAQQYLNKYGAPELAAKKMFTAQVAKCTTSGFLTSLGGLITLPVAVPANVASVLYIQLRMIAATAVLGGYDPHDDEVQTLAYVCLAGTSVGDVCKSTGVQFANKITLAMLKKIPGTTLTKINQKVGFRFITKFGSKGLINLGKMVPVVGGIVGGSLDLATTKIIAKQAYKYFICNDIT